MRKVSESGFSLFQNAHVNAALGKYESQTSGLNCPGAQSCEVLDTQVLLTSVRAGGARFLAELGSIPHGMS